MGGKRVEAKVVVRKVLFKTELGPLPLGYCATCQTFVEVDHQVCGTAKVLADLDAHGFKPWRPKKR